MTITCQFRHLHPADIAFLTDAGGFFIFLGLAAALLPN
jgi:hypothetical protein